MRHGLIKWDPALLSEGQVRQRQGAVRAALRAAGLDALLVYTNHVRSGAVTWMTGFTPYWSDGLVLVPADGPALFATALSKRVSGWIVANNPTCQVLNSPRPGELVGARLAELGSARLGVVELDRLPSGLIDEMSTAWRGELSDASALFAGLRATPDAAETALVARTDAMARAAFAALPQVRHTSGDVSEAAELSVRLAGAEEVYVAIAPDLATGGLLASRKGDVALGEYLALRLSLAFHGVWVRRTETLARSGGDAQLDAARDWADVVVGQVRAGPGLAAGIAALPVVDGFTLDGWFLEAPVGTRPLQIVAEGGRDPVQDHAYGVLTLNLRRGDLRLVFSRPIRGAQS